MKALTQETPAKVLTLLSVAMASMAFMFVVSATDASFAGTRVSVPDPFSSGQVVAAIDSAASGYSRFLAANLFEPAQQNYAVAADNVSWIGQNAHDGLVAMLGVGQSAGDGSQLVPQVAGAETSQPYSPPAPHNSGIGLFTLLGIQ